MENIWDTSSLLLVKFKEQTSTELPIRGDAFSAMGFEYQIFCPLASTFLAAQAWAKLFAPDGP